MAILHIHTQSLFLKNLKSILVTKCQITIFIIFPSYSKVTISMGLNWQTKIVIPIKQKQNYNIITIQVCLNYAEFVYMSKIDNQLF